MRAPAPRALDPARQIIKIASSAAPGNVPTGLQVGELGIDLASPPRLWVGCPPAIQASGLLQLHVADPSGSYLPLSGGTLASPGNLAVNGTLAVSNSDAVSASITNTGSGATGLKITGTGVDNVGLDVEGGSASGRALVARGVSEIGPASGTSWLFSSSLAGGTTNAAANLMHLSGVGGGIFIRLTERANDPTGIYPLAITRNSTRTTNPFIQMFDATGYGATDASGPTRPLGSIWFGGYDGTSSINPYHPHELRSAAIWVEPSETWSGSGHGSRILFDVTANGTTTAQTALTIDHDSSVTVSRINDESDDAPVFNAAKIALSRSRGTTAALAPVKRKDSLGRLDFMGRFGTAIGDVSTGVRIEAALPSWEDWTDTSRQTMLYISNTRPNNIMPQPALWINYEGSVVAEHHLQTINITGSGLATINNLDVGSVASIHGDVTIEHRAAPTRGGKVLLQRVAPVDVSGAQLGSVIARGYVPEVWDPPAYTPPDDPITGNAVPTAEIRFNAAEAWLRDRVFDANPPHDLLSQTMGIGSEIGFFVTRNGTATPYRAMTLENDGNLTVVGTVTASGTLLTSDPALKDDIAQAPSGALAKVCELPVINFRWKHGRDSKMHRGFSADDVMRVMGEDSGCSAKGAYSLADMNAVLWQAVQELSTEVQELRRSIGGTNPRRSH